MCTLGPRAVGEATIDKACAEWLKQTIPGVGCVWMYEKFCMLITVALATLMGVGVFAVVFHFMQISL